jgi:hypothetical protein
LQRVEGSKQLRVRASTQLCDLAVFESHDLLLRNFEVVECLGRFRDCLLALGKFGEFFAAFLALIVVDGKRLPLGVHDVGLTDLRREVFILRVLLPSADSSDAVLSGPLCLQLVLSLNASALTLLVNMLEVGPHLMESLQRRQHELLIFKHADCVVWLHCHFD